MKNRPVAGILMGMAIVTSLSLYAFNRPPAATAEEAQEASRLGLLVDDFLTLKRLGNAKRGTELSNGDFEHVARLTQSGSDDARARAMRVLRVLPRTSAHREQAIQLAKGYLAEGHKEGNVAPIVVLKFLGDDSWKEYAGRMAADSDPNVRGMGKQLLEKP